MWRDFGDVRYNNTVMYMDKMGQQGVEYDGVQIIQQVLWQDGVMQYDTIFTSTQTAYAGQPLTLYNPPNNVTATEPESVLFMQ